MHNTLRFSLFAGILLLGLLGTSEAAAQGSGPPSPSLYAPGEGPAPTTTDATMPASFPPPLQVNPPLTNKLFKAGNNIAAAGAGFGIAGGLFMLFGALTPCELGETDCDQATYDSKEDTSVVLTNIGIGLLITGGVLIVAGVPMIAVGYHRMKKQIKENNPTLSLAPGGLLLQF